MLADRILKVQSLGFLARLDWHQNSQRNSICCNQPLRLFSSENMAWHKNKNNQSLEMQQVQALVQEPVLYPPMVVTKPAPLSKEEEEIFSCYKELRSKLMEYQQISPEKPEMTKYSSKFYSEGARNPRRNFPFIPKELLSATKHNDIIDSGNDGILESDTDEQDEQQQIELQSEDSGDNDYGVDYYDDDLDAFGNDSD